LRNEFSTGPAQKIAKFAKHWSLTDGQPEQFLSLRPLRPSVQKNFAPLLGKRLEINMLRLILARIRAAAGSGSHRKVSGAMNENFQVSEYTESPATFF
jgi:hypothetical protein